MTPVRVLLSLAFAILLVAAGVTLCLALMPLHEPDVAGQAVQGRARVLTPENLEYWHDRLDEVAGQVRRRVRVIMTPKDAPASVILVLELEAPPGSALSQGIFEMETPYRRAMFVTASFGDVTLDDRSLTAEELGTPIVDLTPEHGARVQLRVERFAGSYAWGYLALPELPLAADRLELETHGATVERLSPEPDAAGPDGATLAAAPGHSLRPVVFSLRTLPASAGGGSHRDSRQGVLRRIGAFAQQPLVGALLSAIASALPLLVFLLLLRRGQLDAASLGLPTLVLVIFHLVYFLGTGLLELGDLAPLDQLSQQAEQLVTSYYFPIAARPPALVTCLWPTVAASLCGFATSLLLQSRGQDAEQLAAAAPDWRRSPATRVFLGALAALTLVGLAAAIPMAITWSGTYAQVMLAWSALALVISLWAARSLCAGLGLPGFAAPAALWYTLALLAACLWFVTTAESGPLSGTARFYPFTIVAGVPMILAFVLLAGRLCAPAFAGLRAQLAEHPWVLLIAAALAATPVGHIVHPGTGHARVSEVKNLAHAMDQFAPLLWTAGAAVLLRARGTRGMQLDEPTRRLGLLVFAAIFFSPELQWSYIPLTFLIGWALLEWTLVQHADRWEHLRLLLPRVVERRQQLLDHVLDLHAAERAYSSLREQLGERLARGEIKFNEYDDTLDENLQKLVDLRGELEVGGSAPADVALEFGPRASSWENALLGGKAALLFAAPWILLGLRDLLAEGNPDDSYPMWALAFKLLILPIKWGAYGVFLGYFFPLIKGRSGLAKGFNLFLTVVAAAIPFAALAAGSTEDWRALFIWSLELLVHLLLIGLVAFDLETLKSSGYRDWRLLFAVHDVPALGASFSSIILAVGTIVTAAITSGADSLVKHALRFFLPGGAELPPGGG